MRTVTVRALVALFGTIGTFAMAADYRAGDHDMSYARVMQVEPIYAATVYRDVGRADGYRRAAYVDRPPCETSADGAYREAEEVVAYRVYYRYHGHDLVHEMAYDPGPLLKVHANIEPDD